MDTLSSGILAGHDFENAGVFPEVLAFSARMEVMLYVLNDHVVGKNENGVLLDITGGKVHPSWFLCKE